MTASRACPNCGAELPAGAPAQPCPACLMQLGLQSWHGRQSGAADAAHSPTGRQSPGFTAPLPEDLAPRFPYFEIRRLLGQGGMGAVYEARQKSLDRTVALKIIRPDVAHDAGFAERFAREARALARLGHPNIVTIHDFGTAAPTAAATGGLGLRQEEQSEPREGGEQRLYYLVMEHVDGVSLRDLLNQGSLEPARALSIIGQICEALQYAHDHGIVHRDLKPENILIDRNGRVKMADFGLAKIARAEGDDVSLTGTHQVMGTPRYMAPEQMQGTRRVDHRADIYSLGVVFYEMLTGELPLGRFAPPSTRVQLDVRLDEIVLRTLEVQPERRYQSASEVRTDVQAIVDSRAGERSLESWGHSGLQQFARQEPERHLDAGATRRATVSRGDGSRVRAAVLDQIRGPAIGLIVTGALNWIVVLVVPCMAFISRTPRPQVGIAAMAPPLAETIGLLAQQGSPVLTWDLLMLLIPLLVVLTSGSMIFLSGILLKSGRAWGFGVFGSLLAMLTPPGFVVGLPIGIWTLSILLRQDVRQAFGVPLAGSLRSAARDAFRQDVREAFGVPCQIAPAPGVQERPRTPPAEAVSQQGPPTFPSWLLWSPGTPDTWAVLCALVGISTAILPWYHLQFVHRAGTYGSFYSTPAGMPIWHAWMISAVSILLLSIVLATWGRQPAWRSGLVIAGGLSIVGLSAAFLMWPDLAGALASRADLVVRQRWGDRIWDSYDIRILSPHLGPFAALLCGLGFIILGSIGLSGRSVRERGTLLQGAVPGPPLQAGAEHSAVPAVSRRRSLQPGAAPLPEPSPPPAFSSITHWMHHVRHAPSQSARLRLLAGPLTVLLLVSLLGLLFLKRDDFLVDAVEHRRPRIAGIMLAVGADPNVRTGLGESVLLAAVKDRNLELVRLLLESGAHPRAKTRNGESALDVAIAQNDPEMLALFADVNELDAHSSGQSH